VVVGDTLPRTGYRDSQRTTRAGERWEQTPAHLSQAGVGGRVLLEGAGGHRPVMDAQVFIELEHEAGATVRAEATHRQARNKLLYCSLINLPEAGRWKMKLIMKHGGERAEALGDLTVARPQPMLFSYWKPIAFPPVIIILFIINQWLRRNRQPPICRGDIL
jgi:hypothetical protein